MTSKGPIPSTVIREKGAVDKSDKETSSQYLEKLVDKSLSAKGKETKEKPKTPLIEELNSPLVAPAAESKGEQTPKFYVVHQGVINDYQSFTNAREKSTGARPDALLIRIELPRVVCFSTTNGRRQQSLNFRKTGFGVTNRLRHSCKTFGSLC